MKQDVSVGHKRPSRKCFAHRRDCTPSCHLAWPQNHLARQICEGKINQPACVCPFAEALFQPPDGPYTLHLPTAFKAYVKICTCASRNRVFSTHFRRKDNTFVPQLRLGDHAHMLPQSCTPFFLGLVRHQDLGYYPCLGRSDPHHMRSARRSGEPSTLITPTVVQKKAGTSQSPQYSKL